MAGGSFDMVALNAAVNPSSAGFPISHSPSVSGFSNLEIRTRSVEQTLVPLVTQISALISQRQKLVKSERISLALSKVGQDVCDAVGKFVHIGENIARENVQVCQEMLAACAEAREAGGLLAQIVSLRYDGLQAQQLIEERKLLRAARGLLSSVTKVLLLADKVIVLQILRAKDVVRQALRSLLQADNLSDFVKLFSHYGSAMVTLARLSGERLQDLKDEKRKAQLASARQILEKSTMMLLTATKASLRHPESQEACLNRDLVHARVNEALNLLSFAVTDAETLLNDPELRGSAAAIAQGPYLPSNEKHVAISVVLQRIEDTLEMVAMSLISSEAFDLLKRDLQQLDEALTDFVDSAEVDHEQRERIIQINSSLKEQVQTYPILNLDMNWSATSSSGNLNKSREVVKELRKELVGATLRIANSLLKNYSEQEATDRLLRAALSSDREYLEIECKIFTTNGMRLMEVTRMLKHVSDTPSMLVQADRLETTVATLSRQCVFAAHTLVHRVGSRTAKENLDVFLDAWRHMLRDLLGLVTALTNMSKKPKDVRTAYMSLPRPGKHGATAKQIRTAAADFASHEQARLVKNGLEMQLIGSEMESETEKWDDNSNDIVKRAKNMSSMAYTMYLFTRGEGTLKTTQDLFTQAEYFTEEANRMSRSIRDFAEQVPQGLLRVELASGLERIPGLIQQLSSTIRNPSVGRSATFNKVEFVIQQTKDLMNAIAKLVTTCFICATKYDLDCRHVQHDGPLSSKWRAQLGMMDAVPSSSASGRALEDSESLHSFRSIRSDNVVNLNVEPKSNHYIRH